jgi:hypothetical protein
MYSRYQYRLFQYLNAALCVQYPAVEKGMRFLNSGGFLGPLDQVAELLTAGGHIQNTDDDQLFYTRHVLLRDLCIVAVQCCGSMMTIPEANFFSPSRISDSGSTTTKTRRGENNYCFTFFIAINSTKFESYFIFEHVQKKILTNKGSKYF